MSIEQILARKQPPPEPRVGKTAIDFAIGRMLEQSPKQRSEIDRICSIPIQVPFTDDDLDAIQRLHVKPAAYERGFRLQRVQAEAIQSFMETGSVFGPIEVGGGKCVLGSTEIFDRKSLQVLTVQEVAEQGLTILVDSWDGKEGLRPQRAWGAYSGKKFCVRVSLECGRSIGLSIDHPVLTRFGWEDAGKLLVGQSVATQKGALVHWSRVVSVEPIGIHPVYDLEVSNTHNFVADGIVVHNTLIALRAVAIAFEQGIHRAALFVPSQVHTQLVEHDIGWARQRVHLGVTFYPLGGLPPERRRALAGGRRGCWIFPYSLLSARDASEMLEAIRPELMMFDEAHLLKSRDAARTRRVLTYIKKYRPRVSCLSGTMSSKSIKDYAHLLTACLGEGAPVPHEPQMVQDWANTIDSEQAAEGFHAPRVGTGPLRPLINWANKNFPKTPRAYSVQGFRWAFRDRLLTAPGVVSSPADALGTSLYIENLKVISPTPRLAELQQQLDELWLTPSGDEIEFAMQKWKWATELSAGIYNDLVWPDAGQVAERRGISPTEAESILARSKEHHKLLQAYHKELRGWFQSRPHKPGLDTPMLVGNSMARYGDRDVGSKLYTAWLTARNAHFPEILERDSVPVRVCDYKIKAAIGWMKKHPLGEGIVWYHHQTCGNWLFEEAEKAGLPVVHCPAGKPANDFLTASGAAERCKGKFLVCSISAHGTGKNLQFLQDQLYVQIPHNEMIAQQAIGRTHRQGQQADEVRCTTMISNEQDELILAALLNDAIYMMETLSSSRKLLQAAWNPMPTIYGTRQLQRAGLQSKLLTAKQELLLAERFGKTAPV